jgi:hypothetical protein
LQTGGETERIMTQIIDLDLVSRVRNYGTLGQCQLSIYAILDLIFFGLTEAIHDKSKFFA